MRHNRKDTMVDRLKSDLNYSKGLHLDKTVDVVLSASGATITAKPGSDYKGTRNIVPAKYDLTKAFNSLSGSIKVLAFPNAPLEYGALRALHRYGFPDAEVTDFTPGVVTSSTFIDCVASPTSALLTGKLSPRFTVLSTYTFQDVINYYGFDQLTRKIMLETQGETMTQNGFLEFMGQIANDPNNWVTLFALYGMAMMQDPTWLGTADGWNVEEIAGWFMNDFPGMVNPAEDIVWTRRSGNGVNVVTITTPEARPEQIPETLIFEWESVRMTMDDVFPNKKDGLFGGQSKSSVNDYVYHCTVMAALHNGYEMSPVDLSMAFGTTPRTFSTDNVGDRLAAPKVSELTNVVVLPYNVTLSDTPGSYELGAGEYERDGKSYYCFYLKGDNDFVTGEFVVGFELPTGTETTVDMGSVLVNGKLPNQTDTTRVSVPVRQWMVIIDVLRADYYNTSTSGYLVYTPDGEGQFITRNDQVYPTFKLRATPKP